jgi:hypothetical protein
MNKIKLYVAFLISLGMSQLSVGMQVQKFLNHVHQPATYGFLLTGGIWTYHGMDRKITDWKFWLEGVAWGIATGGIFQGVKEVYKKDSDAVILAGIVFGVPAVTMGLGALCYRLKAWK